jgi:hypothetical protein
MRSLQFQTVPAATRALDDARRDCPCVNRTLKLASLATLLGKAVRLQTNSPPSSNNAMKSPTITFSTQSASLAQDSTPKRPSLPSNRRQRPAITHAPTPTSEAAKKTVGEKPTTQRPSDLPASIQYAVRHATCDVAAHTQRPTVNTAGRYYRTGADDPGFVGRERSEKFLETRRGGIIPFAQTDAQRDAQTDTETHKRINGQLAWMMWERKSWL